MTYFAIVRGPLGVGKTTIARALAQAIGGEVVSIDEILEEQEWDGGSESLFLRANVVAAEQAQAVLGAGVPVVVDGNFYWESAVQDLVGRLPYPHRVFSLQAPLQLCIERDRLRALSYGEDATREVFEKVAGVRCGIPIDATRDTGLIVQEMRAYLAGNGPAA